MENLNNQMESVTEEFSELPSPGEVNPKQKKRWVVPAAAAAAAAAAGMIFLLRQPDPKDAVLDAFGSIMAEEQTIPAEELFGTSELMELLRSGSCQAEMKLTMEDTSIPALGMLTGGSLSGASYHDAENGSLLTEIGIGYAGMDLASLQCYLDAQQAAVVFPELSGKTFLLNYSEDLDRQMEESPILGPQLTEAGIDMNGIADYLEKSLEVAEQGNPLFDLNGLWERYKEGSTAIEELKASMTAEKIEKKDFMIDGKNVSCRGYHAEIPGDELLRFVKATKDFFLADEDLKEEMISYLELGFHIKNAVSSLTGMELQTPKQIQNQIWKDTEDALDSMIEALENSMGDVSMNVYVTKKGKMAGFDYEIPMDVKLEEDLNKTESGGYAEKVKKVYGSMNFNGGYHMLSNVDSVFNLENYRSEVVTLVLQKSGTYEEGVLHTEGLHGTMESGAEKFGFLYEGSYQPENGDYQCSLELLNGEKSQLKMTSEGFFEHIEKGKAIHLVMDSVHLEGPMLTGSNDYLKFSGDCRVEPLMTAVRLPEGEPFDLLAGTEEEYEEAAAEMAGNVFALMMQVYQ